MAYVRTIALCALVTMFLVGCASSSELDVNYENPGNYDAIKFVRAAVTLAREEGKNAALGEFMALSTPFKRGQFYIFAVDFNGKVLAHGYQRELVGQTLMNLRDSNGVAIVESLAKKAKQGSGWVTYLWRNPVTGDEETKQAYVENVNNKWFIGTGFYPSETKVE